MARNKESALARARRHLAEGRPDLARETLKGYLYTLHQRGDYDVAAYDLLGETFFQMRDYARAGAAWLLTERSDADAQRAIEAFHARFGNDPVNILRALRPHARSEAYPPAVQERLKSRNYRYVPYHSRNKPRASQNIPDEEALRGLRPVELGCLMAVIGFVIAAGYWLWMRFLAR